MFWPLTCFVNVMCSVNQREITFYRFKLLDIILILYEVLFYGQEGQDKHVF